MPHNVPVINLRILVDGRTSIYCIYQSPSITKPKHKHNSIGTNIFSTNKRTPTKYPAKIPVQRAHNGNCIPFIKKLLSGI